jgi:hypothetical protein
MIKVAGIRIPLTYDEELLSGKAAELLGLEADRIVSIKLDKRTLDTADKEDIHYLITLLVTVKGDENEIVWRIKDKKITREIEVPYIIPQFSDGNRLEHRPFVVGCGPAGMFAALILAQAGACPILLERGMDVESRSRSVQSFWRTGILDIENNVQFGAGGAGTFSDGKLKIGMKDAHKIKILQELVEAGAPPEILYENKPHIGTDRLHAVVKYITAKIVNLGGEVYYKALVTKILCRDKCESQKVITGVGFTYNGVYSERRTDHLILAIGHSARDTFSYLASEGIPMEQKPFAVGVRIEHPQALINRIQYKNFAGDSRLGAADYKMVVHLPNGRAVYTFCMCPGGSVVAAASEAGGLVTNGMSRWKRDGTNANTALLVTVEKRDLQSDDPLAGVAFQRRIEKAAFFAGGSSYRAPVQRLEDFFQGRQTVAFGDVRPTYSPGTEFARVESYLPGEAAESLKQGLAEMGEWMPGYAYPDAVLTGAETRSTSPVRMTRGTTFEAMGIKGLYPCGEGAGYAGGIISAAVDGVLAAEQILSRL